MSTSLPPTFSFASLQSGNTIYVTISIVDVGEEGGWYALTNAYRYTVENHANQKHAFGISTTSPAECRGGGCNTREEALYSGVERILVRLFTSQEVQNMRLHPQLGDLTNEEADNRDQLPKDLQFVVGECYGSDQGQLNNAVLRHAVAALEVNPYTDLKDGLRGLPAQVNTIYFHVVAA
jgi:hypothetical protein